jgi:hypothetical protein
MLQEQTKAEQTPPLQPATTFPIGAAVRVKKGVKDPDFPDMPLGGWAGLVKDVKADPDGTVYLVEWNSYTLARMHPVYRRRCERDGLELTTAWLGADELENDAGGPPEMEQPTDIRPRPLDAYHQDDRIRAIFSLTSDEALPPVTDATLRTYHQHLKTHLILPVTVEYLPGNTYMPGNSPPLMLCELLAPKDDETVQGLRGITEQGDQRQQLLLSDLEVAAKGESWQLLADYAYWFMTFREASAGSDGQEQQNEPEAAAVGLRTVINAVSRCGLYGAAAGAAVGAVTATLDGVLFAMGVGAVTMALVGYVAGTRYGFFFGKVHRINSGPILGGIFGIVAGAVAGVVAGPLVIAYLGTIVGSILGALVGQLLRFIHKRLPGPMALGLAGAGLGAIVLAWTEDPERTLTGVMYGIAGGAAAGLVLSAGFFGALVLLEMNREESP